MASRYGSPSLKKYGFLSRTKVSLSLYSFIWNGPVPMSWPGSVISSASKDLGRMGA